MANNALVGLKTVQLRLEQFGKNAVAGVSVGLGVAAETLANRVSSFMPFDTGTLEGSVEVVGVGGDGSRNAAGQFTRKSYTVKINSNKVNPKSKKKVGSYAWLMNESLAPYGSGAYHMRDGSLEKATMGLPVGGHFMERAEEEIRQEIAEIVLPYVRAGLRGAVSVGSSRKVHRRSQRKGKG